MAIVFRSRSILALAVRTGLPCNRFAVGLLLLATAAAGQAQAQGFSQEDLTNEILVLQALHNDPRLAPLNLVVKVHDHVATLWGPVPTRELAERAVAIVKKLPVIGTVHNQMMIQYRDETVMPPMPLVPALPPGRPPAKKETRPPAPVEPLGPPMVELVWRPATQETPAKSAAPVQSVHLLPPITSQASLTGTVSRPKEFSPTEPADTAAVSNAVQSLILGEERYRRVRYEVKEGKVFLGGVVYRWSDLRELSMAVTHIPGVSGVVLREVRAEPRK
jgi:osmotically-inducible protein OsmY